MRSHHYAAALPLLLVSFLRRGREGGGADAFLLPAAATTTRTSTPPLRAQAQATYYAAAGAPSVDMGRYDLPLERCCEEWTAVLQAETSMSSEGIYLRAKSDDDCFVDTLSFALRREGGLGLLLTEIAGGREDGVGITIVEEVLAGGNAENSGIVAGDSIVAASVTSVMGENGSRNAQELRTQVATECLGYDATVAALTSLPPPSSPDDEVVLTVKRVRRQPKVKVTLQYPPHLDEPDARVELFAGENLRRAMLNRGVKLNDRLAERFDSGGSGDCGSDGTCATCVVAVARGEDLLSPAGAQEGQILKAKPRWRMACKAVVGYGMTEGDMTLQVSPRQWES